MKLLDLGARIGQQEGGGLAEIAKELGHEAGLGVHHGHAQVDGRGKLEDVEVPALVLNTRETGLDTNTTHTYIAHDVAQRKDIEVVRGPGQHRHRGVEHQTDALDLLHA